MIEPGSLNLHLEAITHARILVLGDLMLDRYVYGAVERISPEAPIPVLKVGREQAMPGGAANVARNIAALGGRASLIGLVGADDAGGVLKRLLDSEPRIAANLVVDAGRLTTQKVRFVAGAQQLLRADTEQAHPSSETVAGALLEAFDREIATADLLVLSDYAKGVLSDAVLSAVIERARAEGKPVIADPKSVRFERYRGVRLLTPNQHEIAAATGLACEGDSAAAEAGLSVVRSCGIPAVLVTRGERGMTLVQSGEDPLHLPAEAREVFDVSGAGDTVVATLAVMLAAGADLPEAARLANLAAGIVVGKFGTALVHPADLAAAVHARTVTASSDAKITTLAAALERVAFWRGRGERIGFTNGCFDLIHPGHVSLLQQARAACDRLIVGLNTDASVRRQKGPDRPVQDETKRAVVLAALGAVDLVVPFEEDTPIDMIKAIRPDLLVKGADYRLDQVVGASFVQGYGGRVMLVPLVPDNSTTGTIARIGRGAG